MRLKNAEGQKVPFILVGQTRKPASSLIMTGFQAAHVKESLQ